MKTEGKENKNSLLAICRSSAAAGRARSNCYEFFGSFCRYKKNEEKLLSPAANDNPELFQYYFNANHLGSGSLITDESGATYQTLAYAPHGDLLVNEINGNYDEPYKFTGYERDQESGLDYAHARYREPDKTIFYSTEPKWKDFPHITPYAYCANNPIMRIDPDGLYDISSIKDNQNYGVIAVYQSNYLDVDKQNGNNVLANDIKAAQKAGIPVIFVDNIADYADAMTAISDKGSSTSTYTLNSHGAYNLQTGTRGFYIGSDYVNANTNVSSLASGLNGKDVFIGACQVTEDNNGIKTIENFSKQTSSTVFAKDSKVASGYKYNGGSGLSDYSILNDFVGMFGGNVDNAYHVSFGGRAATQIYNLSIEKSGRINYNYGNRSLYQRVVDKSAQIMSDFNYNLKRMVFSNLYY